MIPWCGCRCSSARKPQWLSQCSPASSSASASQSASSWGSASSGEWTWVSASESALIGSPPQLRGCRRRCRKRCEQRSSCWSWGCSHTASLAPRHSQGGQPGQRSHSDPFLYFQPSWRAWRCGCCRGWWRRCHGEPQHQPPSCQCACSICLLKYFLDPNYVTSNLNCLWRTPEARPRVWASTGTPSSTLTVSVEAMLSVMWLSSEVWVHLRPNTKWGPVEIFSRILTWWWWPPRNAQWWWCPQTHPPQSGKPVLLYIGTIAIKWSECDCPSEYKTEIKDKTRTKFEIEI